MICRLLKYSSAYICFIEQKCLSVFQLNAEMIANDLNTIFHYEYLKMIMK